MSEQKQNKLALTMTALNEAKGLQGVFELEAFKYNFVDNYVKTTGKDNGSLIFERERVLFMKALQDNKKIEKCSRFSIYSSFIELAVSGLTLNDGISYIIPYGTHAQFQIGWKGRLEQISQMPEINFVNEPQVVYASELDDFDYELGENPKVIKHKPRKGRGTNGDPIEYVYLILDTRQGKKTWIMSQSEVYAIRDTYSQTYKSYMADCAKYGKKPGETFKKPMSGPNGSYELTVEPPFWITSESEAWKKTIVKRAYKYLPKTPRMKAIDEKIKTHLDPEDGTIEQTHDINYGVVQDEAPAQIPQGQTEEVAPVGKVDKETKQAKTRAPRVKPEAPAVTLTPEPGSEKVDKDTGEVIPVVQEEIAAQGNPVDELPNLADL